MSKQHTTLNCDSELLKAAKRESINMSRLLEESLKTELFTINPETYNFNNGWRKKVIMQEIEIAEQQILRKKMELKRLDTPKKEVKDKDVTAIKAKIKHIIPALKNRFKEFGSYYHLTTDKLWYKTFNDTLKHKISFDDFKEYVFEPAIKEIEKGKK